MNDTMQYVFMGIVLFFSLSVHESAHAYAAHLFGDDTAKMLGRISLNPIRHVDLFGTIIFPAILILSGSGILFGWAKPVPVNPMNLRNPSRDYGWVSFAGPLSNLIIGLAAFILLKITVMAGAGKALFTFLFLLLAINVILALFNLIPVHPLDGGSVLEALLPRQHRHVIEPLKTYGFLILLVILFTGIFGKVIQLLLGILYFLVVWQP